jgi:hypothetical protein
LGRIVVLFVAAVAGLGLPVTAVATPASGVVPPGFMPSSTSWTSARNGWVLGFSPCAKAECASLVHTVDGGRSWLRSPAPPVQLTPEHDQVRVRFANELDGLITDGHRIFATHSAGQRWQLVALPAAQIGALASNDRYQYAILSDSTGTRLYASPLHSTRWAAVPGIELLESSGGGDIAARGTSAFVALTSIFRSASYWSTVDSQGWRWSQPPCTAEAQPRLGLARDRTLFALCSHDPGRGFMAKDLERAEPDGSFSHVSTAPPAGISTGFDAASRSTVAIAAVGAGAAFIHRGTDRGTTWATPFVGDEVPLFDLGFTDATHGTLVSGGPGWGSAAVFRTTDGAATWTELTIR